MSNNINFYNLGPQYFDYCIDELGHIFHPTKKNRCLDDGGYHVGIIDRIGVVEVDRYEMFGRYVLGIPKREIKTKYKMVLKSMLETHESLKAIKEQTVQFYMLEGRKSSIIGGWFRKIKSIGHLETDYIFRKHSSVPTCVLHKDVQAKVNADWIEYLHNYPNFYIFYCNTTNNHQVINLKKNEIVETKSINGIRVYRMSVNRAKYCGDINVKYVSPHDSCVPYKGLKHFIHPATPANILSSWKDDVDLMYPSIQKGGS